MREQTLANKTEATDLSETSDKKDVTVPWMPAGWSENKEHEVTDAVSLVLWIKEPLYRTATQAIRRAMEREETESLLTSIEGAFTTHNGKGRGWIKKHLEEAFSSQKEYKHNEFWKGVQEEKRLALIMDFVCIVRNLRVALWFPSTSSDEVSNVTVIPHMCEQRSQIIQLNASTAHLLLDGKGSPFVGGREWPALTMAAKEFTWIPATSAPSIGSQTVLQIRSRLQALGTAVTAVSVTSEVKKEKEKEKETRASLWKRVQWLELVQSLSSPSLPSPSLSSP